MAKDEFKPWPRQPEYLVSSDGRVIGPRGRELVAIWRGRPKYRCVNVVRLTEKAHKMVKIAVMVLETYVGLRPDGMVACHRDDNRENDTMENLYWGTPKQNTQDILRNGNNFKANMTHCIRGHELTAGNVYLRKATDKRAASRRCKTCHLEQQRARNNAPS